MHGYSTSFIRLPETAATATKETDYMQNPGKKAQAKEYEKLIDQPVYQLYGLSDEEIKIVEGETK